ncbi:hypothetical protein [Telmatospirillum sp.]|uniref:hypothetical protein n=1 Tax=Telmatospirillum sp. TaxID=2079197 RepID=UPI00284A2328|nr:hypothetical protein [Telmatospirillum sp.]MDR3436702.1 hypothetical protein [Telmatospirillum sp.]
MTSPRLAVWPWLTGLAVLCQVGCTTLPAASVTTFGQGVDKVRLQFDTTFASINQMATEDEIDQAVLLPTLTEASVAVVVPQADIDKWDKAITVIDGYVAKLVLLLSPDQANTFETAADALGTSLAKLDPDSLPSAGVAAGFLEAGRLLIEAKAETDAIAVAKKADPAMRMIFSAMAAAVGSDHHEGLRGTVWAHWQERMGVQQVAFLTAKAAGKRDAVVAYIDSRDKRDTQDLQLGSLRQSLLDLAGAHAALARGSAVELGAAIAMIQQELDNTRTQISKFSAMKPKAKE